jgi:hypothetical protein
VGGTRADDVPADARVFQIRRPAAGGVADGHLGGPSTH